MRRLLVVAFALLAMPALARAADWSVDGARSNASFTVKHMMVSTVRGEMHKLAGSVSWSKPDYSDAHADVSIDPATIDTGDGERDEHLRSPDFFDVQKFPTLTFVSKRVDKSKRAGHVVLVGDLTIHGVTKVVAFDVTLPAGAQKSYRAEAKINRRDFGLTWNRAIETGGVMVSDEVALDITLALTRKSR
jgi:polyisoprenoid-binding protein YceI